MSQNTYDVGDLVELVGTFTDPVSGDPVDPSSVVCRVRTPDGETTTVAANGSDGVYVAEFEVAAPGSHHYLFVGTGGHQAAGERAFYASTPRVERP